MKYVDPPDYWCEAECRLPAGKRFREIRESGGSSYLLRRNHLCRVSWLIDVDESPRWWWLRQICTSLERRAGSVSEQTPMKNIITEHTLLSPRP